MKNDISAEAYIEACRRIANLIAENPPKDKKQLHILKAKVSKEYMLEKMPKNSEILSCLPKEEHVSLYQLLKIKSVRSASGIVVVAVMSRPYPCPQDPACLYCPGGVQFGSPQSYTGYEPAAKRGKENNYDPFSQVKNRIEQLKAIGHEVQKIELIVMGGTFLNQPPEYQRYFIKGCFDGLNGFAASSLEEAIRFNEEADVRNVGLTIETRPDFCKQPHVDTMLGYGVTRVEIGVQNPSDRIYQIVGRKHTVHDVIEAFRIAKDSGFKIVAHMMPGLPGSSIAEDIIAFRRLYEDSSLRPDMMKVYPTLVVENSQLYKMYLNNEYIPYPDEVMVDIVAQAMSIAPFWLRIMRVQRDIPSNLIVAGIKKSNLRELANERLKVLGKVCHCIRCREIGLLELKEKGKFSDEDMSLYRIDYEASEGKEVFISFENQDRSALVGFLRLRKPSKYAQRPEVQEAALVRELHVYGLVTPLGSRLAEGWQHKGYGRRLIEEGEKIVKEEFGLDKILVTSAVGTRRYYEKLGYSLTGPYMGKRIQKKS